MLLRVEGYHVTAVAALAEAVARARQAPRLDLLITDYRLLDGHSGMQVVAAVREELGIPVRTLLVTGDTTGGDEGSAQGFKTCGLCASRSEPRNFCITLNTLLAS